MTISALISWITPREKQKHSSLLKICYLFCDAIHNYLRQQISFAKLGVKEPDTLTAIVQILAGGPQVDKLVFMWFF